MTIKAGRIIENVTIEEIDSYSGNQLCTYIDDNGNRAWKTLSGFNRAKDIKAGDRGKLVYRSDGKLGLYWFEKYEEGKE